jgi:hypothetical protein
MSAINTVPLFLPAVISAFGTPFPIVASDSPGKTYQSRGLKILVTAGVLRVGFQTAGPTVFQNYPASIQWIDLFPPDNGSIDLTKVMLDGTDNTARANIIAWPCRI